MHLILTHEQADFDALGAMLGAYLMNEGAYPVLPRRMNRNCRAFLALYGSDLPFVESVDLPPGPVETVTLVDTQSLVTLKGMSTRTRVQVVDHHNLRPDLPKSWEVRTDTCGACTTLFVEGLSEHNGHLQPLHATLMMLGIYEDTGSLTYATTTARDVKAAGFLLERGASLPMAVRSLNPALSAEQRAVCDRLLASAETFTIHHLPLVVATAEALDLTDEISSIAHKLRDLLDPAGLFLLVRTVEGIRLVARSTSDRVDVGAVAVRLGGGGHARAAAALVRLPSPLAPEPDPLGAVRAELVRLLPEYVRPAATVRMIMSRGARVLHPDTPLKEAAHLMQRYGYEGFPVVADSKVAGLLTRRAVDRALAHKLNLKAGSLMEAGEIFVEAEDSVDRLREVMSRSGWGQVPVYDRQAGEVVGIVTRTDLLKQLGERPGEPLSSNYAQRLDAALPPARLALLKTVAAAASSQHMAIYIVGGFVRDLILGRPGLDFDMVVEGEAISLARLLQQRFGGHITAHSRFGTAKWSIGEVRGELARALAEDGRELCPADLPDTLDLISARTEFYDYPTALPTVERSSIKLDLHRRDFTINTFALRLDGRHYGELYDYWGGMRDLRERRIRVLHSLSFVDDPTRQLRAVRFEQRFGFEIEARTLELMREGIPLIRHLSGERLRHELDLMLQEERVIAMLRRLAGLGLLGAIHPDLPELDLELESGLLAALQGDLPQGWDLPEKAAHMPLRSALAYLVWMGGLAPDSALRLAQHIRLPGALCEMVVQASQLRLDIARLIGQPNSRVTRRLDQLDLPALYAVFLVRRDARERELIEMYVGRLRKIWPYTSGTTLRERGLTPGPVYKEILTALRGAWLDGQIASQAEEEALLRELWERYGG